MRLFARATIPPSVELHIDGQTITIAVRIHARARNYRLSLPATGPVLTLPPNGRWADAEQFLTRQRHWLAARLPRNVPPIVLRPGAIIPVRGVEHLVVASNQVRGRVEIIATDTMVLQVPGAPEHQPRRLLDWLKQEAEIDLKHQSSIHAQNLGVTIASIKLRGQTTRWGSCSSSGNLNFNWRLILAPPFVLDYVAAHEVAHLVEMNHSPAFWATLRQTLPEMARGRAWLKANGRQLMAYGR